MVSPRNRDDETCGGILSKDFSVRAAMPGRGSWPWRGEGGVAAGRKGEMKNFGPGPDG
jgi:hypothetical protein